MVYTVAMISYSEIGRARGRPTKYSHKVVKFTREYLNSCAKNNLTPFGEELALKLNVSDSTLWNWRQTHTEFDEIYELLLTFQKLDLKKKALSGQYVSKVACLLLSNDHNVTLKHKMELRANVVEEKVFSLNPSQRELYSKAITKIFEQIYSQPKIALSG